MGGAHSGSREWIHSGQLKHTGIFIRPPRPGSSSNTIGYQRPPFQQGVDNDRHNNNGNDGLSGSLSTLGANPDVAEAKQIESGDGAFVPAGAATVDLVVATAHGGDEGGDTDSGVGGGGAGAGGRTGIRTEAEDAWSCCGKTIVSAGRGCEPREPLATVSFDTNPEPTFHE